MDEKMHELHEQLGFKRTFGGAGGGGGTSFGTSVESAEMPPLGARDVEELARQVEADPDGTLARARKAWDASLTLAELRTMIADAQTAVKQPDKAKFAIAAIEDLFAKPLNGAEVKTWFPGYTDEIPILPGLKKLETMGDALGWVLLCGPALVKAWAGKKAPLRRHDAAASGFVYKFEWPAGAAHEVGLFADFGTGLYHSRYIAKHITAHRFPYVVHLGDVYYAGRAAEFDENFTAPLQTLIKQSKFFAMNANHEMYSGGGPYFAYLDEKKKVTEMQQEQEGSYFCLRGDDFQLVGIDTDYFEENRHKDAQLNVWLRDVLKVGREKRLLNILLSPDEPYQYGKKGTTPLLATDLREIAVTLGLVDLWFWGNTHYCALFDRSAETPFIGSCIGHAGYPYDRMQAGNDAAPAKTLFLEDSARFPAATGLRQDRGNNGYCYLRFPGKGSVEIHYVDWMGNKRCVAKLTYPAVAGTPLSVSAVEVVA